MICGLLHLQLLITLIGYQGHLRYYKGFQCLYLKQYMKCAQSIKSAGCHNQSNGLW